jgi:tetratricopeptide (TPR) repeat protein
VFALSAFSALPSAAAAIVSPDYEELLRLYARGERAAALAALGQMRSGHLDQQVRALQRAAKDGARCPSCPDPLEGLPLKAAVMLHVDRDEADRPPARGTEQPRLCPAEHARRAGQVAAILALREPGKPFARQFFLAMAERAQWDFCLDAAIEWGRDGLERFPRDPLLLLTVGAAYEEQATLLAPPSARSGPVRPVAPQVTRSDVIAERRLRYSEARRFFVAAALADPASLAARLRLGRVEWRLGNDDAALSTLTDAVRGGGAPRLLGLAHLFLGQLHERAGRTDAALREFREAQGLDPESQAAAVALSEVSWTVGDAAGARSMIEGALTLAGKRSTRDAYWDYLASNAASADELFEELRRETLE